MEKTKTLKIPDGHSQDSFGMSALKAGGLQYADIPIGSIWLYDRQSTLYTYDPLFKIARQDKNAGKELPYFVKTRDRWELVVVKGGV